MQRHQALYVFQNENTGFVLDYVVKHMEEDVASSLLILEALLFTSNAKRLARETGNIEVNLWCLRVVPCCNVIVKKHLGESWH